MNLTPKQEAWLDAYLENGGNAAQAAIAAGSKPKQAASDGYKIKNSAGVKDALNQLTLAERDQLGVSANYILGRLKRIADDETAPSATRVQALKQLGHFTELNIWNNKTEITGAGGAPLYNEMPQEEVLMKLKEMLQEDQTREQFKALIKEIERQ